jgi:hypothetical protein
MEPIIISLIGAGSRSFGPETVRDVLLSQVLAQRRVELRLMDILADSLLDIGRYAKSLVEKLGRSAEVSTTTRWRLHSMARSSSSPPSKSSGASIGRRTSTSRANTGSARSLPRTAGRVRCSTGCAP